MKNKVCIMTINGYNFGNRLQNYALQEILKRHGFVVETLKNDCSKYDYSLVLNKLYVFLHKLYVVIKNPYSAERRRKFDAFNKYIRFSKFCVNNNKKSWNKKLLDHYDFFICGSDQIWNPSFISNAAGNFLYYVPKNKKITYAPSFGTDSIQQSRKDEYKKYLKSFADISIREERGKAIIKELIGYNDTKVLVDPTLLLTTSEWDEISRQPEQYSLLNGKKYILNYFLGNVSESRKNAIKRIAEENHCEIVNLLDRNDPFYSSGPSEFLYLEKNAFLICTDSFHSSVFAILYNRPFVVFTREDKMISMNSRIQTLLSKLKLENREYNEKFITYENLKHDYTKAYEILVEERKKSDNYLIKSLHTNRNNK